MWAILSIFCFLTVCICSTAAQDGCKVPAVIEANSGRIESPYYSYYPNFTYPSSVACQWTIKVPDGMNIMLTFRDRFELETWGPSYPCRNADYVTIMPKSSVADPQSSYPCHSLETPPLTFCGASDNGFPPIVIEGNEATIRFCTNSFWEFQGFRLDFESTTLPASTDPTEAPTPPVLPQTTDAPFDCPDIYIQLNSSATVTEFYIESPGFPERYPAKAKCSWSFDMEAVPEKTLYVSAESFDLAVDPNPLNLRGADGLGISEYYDGDNDERYRMYAGTNGPTGLRLRGGFIIIAMETRLGSSFPAAGFRLRIKISDCPVTAGFCVSAPMEDICFTDDMMCDGKTDCPGAVDEHCPLGCGVPALSPLPSTKGTRILGGIEAKPHSWPWQVAFLADHHKLLCSGSIIDHSWILTGATCCDVLRENYPWETAVSVLVGKHDLSNRREPNAVIYLVDKVAVYPTGQTYHRPDDFCLVKTKSKIFFNQHVMPVCLPSIVERPLNTPCYVTGWGLSDDPRTAAYGSARLKQADLKIAAPNKCMGAPLDPALAGVQYFYGQVSFVRRTREKKVVGKTKDLHSYVGAVGIQLDGSWSGCPIFVCTSNAMSLNRFRSSLQRSRTHWTGSLRPFSTIVNTLWNVRTDAIRARANR